MINKIRHALHCEVAQENSGKVVSAEILSFNQGRNLTVVMNKTVKLLMTWNGRAYEGRMAGLDFISNGPSVENYTRSR